MPAPTTIHDLIASHRQTIEHFAYGPVETEPAAFICQLGELADHYHDTILADAAGCLSSAVTCLSEALDRADDSRARQEFLHAADKHLHQLAAYV